MYISDERKSFRAKKQNSGSKAVVPRGVKTFGICPFCYKQMNITKVSLKNFDNFSLNSMAIIFSG